MGGGEDVVDAGFHEGGGLAVAAPGDVGGGGRAIEGAVDVGEVAFGFEVSNGGFMFEEEDRALVFTLTDALPALEKMFQGR